MRVYTHACLWAGACVYSMYAGVRVCMCACVYVYVLACKHINMYLLCFDSRPWQETCCLVNTTVFENPDKFSYLNNGLFDLWITF